MHLKKIVLLESPLFAGCDLLSETLPFAEKKLLPFSTHLSRTLEAPFQETITEIEFYDRCSSSIKLTFVSNGYIFAPTFVTKP